MSHPLKNVIKHNHQMAGIFDDLTDALKKAGQSAIDKGKSAGITNTLSTIFKNTEVQNAVQEQANESAIQQLATMLRSGQTSVATYYKENPLKSKLFIGAAAIALVGGVVYLIRGRR